MSPVFKSEDLLAAVGGAIAGVAINRGILKKLPPGAEPTANIKTQHGRQERSQKFIQHNCAHCDFMDKTQQVLDRLAGREGILCTFPGELQVRDNECWPKEQGTDFVRVTVYPPAAEGPVTRIGRAKDVGQWAKDTLRQ